MTPRVHADVPGPKFSEGARLLWAAMQREALSQDQLRKDLGITVGVVGRWMRGERRPDTKSRGLLLDRFAIPFTAWDEPISEPFSFPRGADESGSLVPVAPGQTG